MPTATWTHGGSPLNTANFSTFSGVSGTGDAQFIAPVATWLATTNENGTTGVVNVLADGGNPFFAGIVIAVQLFDDGSFTGTDAVNTIRIAFDYTVVNGPMGTATAKSEFTALAADGPIGAGTTSGTLDQTVDGVTYGIPTIDDLFFFWGSVGGIAAVGFNYSMYYEAGTFSAHDRNITISNFLVEVNYGSAAPVVTDVSPTHGDARGGTVVTLTGTGFTGTTIATFNGSTTAFTPNGDTSGTCVTPSHAVGAVTVTVS